MFWWLLEQYSDIQKNDLELRKIDQNSFVKKCLNTGQKQGNRTGPPKTGITGKTRQVGTRKKYKNKKFPIQ